MRPGASVETIRHRPGRETRPLSIRRHRRRVDRAIRAGRTVTVREFVEAYCDLEDTPRGRVPKPDTLERLRWLATEHAATIRDVAGDAPGDDPESVEDPEATAPSEAAVWYVVAVGSDVRSVVDSSDAAVIRRLPDALFACVPHELGQRLRREHRRNVHVYSSPAPAMAAFGLFDQP